MATIVPAVWTPDLVLDRAADATRDVERGFDDLAGLADLLAVADPARIDHRASGADGPTERVGEILDELQAVGVADAAPATDDDPCLLDGRGGTGLGDGLDDLHGGQLRHGASATVSTAPGRRRLLRGDRSRSNDHDPAAVIEDAMRHELAAERAHLDLRSAVRPIDTGAVDEHRHFRQPDEQPGDVLAVVRRADEHDVRLVLPDECGQPRRDHRRDGTAAAPASTSAARTPPEYSAADAAAPEAP